MSLKDKNIVVTGGSRGLGLGLVEALVARTAKVTVVARDVEALDSVRARLGVATIAADVTDETAAQRILGQTRPYKWWNWNESYVPNAAPDPKWVEVSDAGEAAFRKRDS